MVIRNLNRSPGRAQEHRDYTITAGKACNLTGTAINDHGFNANQGV